MLYSKCSKSCDLAYLIEFLWGRIRPRIKGRAQKILKELKRNTLEEWKTIQKKLIKETGENYIYQKFIKKMMKNQKWMNQQK